MEKLMEHWLFVLPLFIFFYIIKNPNIIRNIEDIYEDYFSPTPKGTIVLESVPHMNKNSIRYQAIMWYLSNNNNESIIKSHEVFFKKYNYRTEEDESKHFFRIDQQKEFKVSDDIFGKVATIEKEETIGNNKNKGENYILTLFSYKLSVNKLIKFLDNLVNEYKKYQVEKNLSKPIIVEAIFNKKDDIFDNNYYNWDSNVSFKNKFFENKKKILNQIDFFLNNPKYFEKKGIPYQLGILLHGIPGCGKTSFIKALAKKTERHIIDIKLNNNINLTELKRLFLQEELDESLVIPINKRLYVLEDIDVMGEIVHKRKQEKNTEDSDSDSEKEQNVEKKILKIFKTNKLEDYKQSIDNNNMSYLLNILDGIQENKGRIIIMTTNHIEKIDPAIIRPGRIDININFKPAKKRIIEEILTHYWDKNVKLDFKINPTPHCKIVEICRSSDSLDETIEKLKELD